MLGQGIFLALDLRHTADSLIDRQLLFAVVLRLDIVLHCAERQPLIGLLAGFLLDGFSAPSKSGCSDIIRRSILHSALCGLRAFFSVVALAMIERLGKS